MISEFFSSPAMKPIRRDLRALADDASKLAHKQMMDPAMDALRQTREALYNRAMQAEKYTAQQCDRIAQDIAAKPFVALGIAFGAGWLLASIIGLASSRNA